MKFNHILCLTDFSEEARRAYAPAAELARACGAKLTLLHLISALKVVPHGAPLAPSQTEPDIHREVEHAKEAIAREAAEFPGDGNVETAVSVVATVGEGVAEFADKNDVDLITISTHGRSGLRRLVLGSTAEMVMRHACVPVLALPPAAEG